MPFSASKCDADWFRWWPNTVQSCLFSWLNSKTHVLSRFSREPPSPSPFTLRNFTLHNNHRPTSHLQLQLLKHSVANCNSIPNLSLLSSFSHLQPTGSIRLASTARLPSFDDDQSGLSSSPSCPPLCCTNNHLPIGLSTSTDA